MDIVNILKSKNLDLPYDNDESGIVILLRNKFEILKEELYKFAEEKKSEVIGKVIEEVEVTTEEIIAAFQKYFSGDITGACNIVNNVMFRSEYSFKKVSEYYEKYIDYTYFRARIRTELDKAFHKKEELFHIPFEKRHCVKNQRYSVTGFPCMYLGATPYTCYEELGRPVEELYFVKVEIPKNYNLITIGLLPYELKDHFLKYNNVNIEEVTIEYLKVLPIIMACSVKVDIKRKESPFKEEYIIPQLITQWLITSGTKFDGILYFSTATPTHSARNSRLYQNLMLPVKEVVNTGYCKKLLSDIKLTTPISSKGIELFEEYDYERFLKFDDLSDLQGNGLVYKDGNSSIHYSVSGFRLIEAILSQKECSVIE